MRRWGLVIMLLASTAAGPATASAGTLTIEVLDGSWSGVEPGPVTDIDNSGSTWTIRWGSGLQSGYDFIPHLTTSVVPGDGTPFLLGTFVHHNNPIVGGDLARADLSFVLGGSGLSSLLSGTLAFEHAETLNWGTPCPFGGANGQGVNANGCADRVVVMTPVMDYELGDGAVRYMFALLGFSTDGGLTISHEFLTMEGRQNVAGLYGVLRPTESVVVNPEPASLVLLGTGLAALAYHHRQRPKRRVKKSIY